MAIESVSTPGAFETARFQSRHYDRGTLRLAQAKALIEMIGIAAQYGPDSNIPAADAAGGVIELLEQAGDAFEKARVNGS